MHAQARIYLDGMYCRECKDVIALALRNKNGIIHADVSYAKAVADIAYDDTMTDVKQIIETNLFILHSLGSIQCQCRSFTFLCQHGYLVA
ncbi:Copper chaperone CopZ [Anaerocolumna jejuensis DSM 15929]|uniref:Copper chaperone CopZ n=1 Tax=Anaerocolumna jejuensis DSM 15929 TaxID=1121322 RepID=A0A1M7A8D0_9FIRM|nr:heavy-metal-associated domain-containing protein [Anaerocolumna jejuensis]SHL38950.1 Copper chaperone CopZ [Anaerocolumna jejuensis DSM 15929]